MQLIRNVASIYHLTEKYMKWQATNSWRSKSIGYNSTRFVEMYFTVALRDLKIHFRILFYFVTYVIHLSFHLFHFSRNLMHNLEQERSRSSSITVWRLETWNNRKSKISNLFVSLQGGAVVSDGFLSQLQFMRQKRLKGTFLKFFSIKL